MKDLDADGKLVDKMVETSVGRVIVNGIIPEEVGYVNKIISKKSLRDIIADVIKLWLCPCLRVPRRYQEPWLSYGISGWSVVQP